LIVVLCATTTTTTGLDSPTRVDEKWEVFLGGSCNPTTWRRDLAIPLLDDAGIT
jgi:hypothetical protein